MSHDLAFDLWDHPGLNGMFGTTEGEALRHNKLKFFENALLRYSVSVLRSITVEKAREFVHRGFILRHMMMQRSRIHVRDMTIERTEPLDPYLATDLATQINAYYINLTGALDNLAWAIAIQHSLAPMISENEPRSRQFCTLTSKKFRQALIEHFPVVEEPLVALLSWYEEVKAFRDPAAHRLPLSLVSSLLTTEDAQRASELTRQATEAIVDGDVELWSRLTHERELLGRFLPLLSGPRSKDGDLVAAPNQMAFDQVSFLKLSSLLLSRCFDRDYKKNAAT